MSWPIPVFPKIEYPKPISWRFWLPTLAVIAVGVVGAVLMLWPRGKPTNTFLFWGTLVGAPLAACALMFGFKLDHWEDEQTDAEEAEKEQHRLKGLWREWTRRRLCVVDAVAFPAALEAVMKFAEPKADLPSQKDRAVEFERAKGRSAEFRRTRLIHLVAMRFADSLRSQREVVVTLMLDDMSLKQIDSWTRRVKSIFRHVVPGVSVQVSAQPASSGVDWITELADRVDSSTRIVIAAQFWGDGEDVHKFSEGAAAFLIAPNASHSGAIYRPMTSITGTLDTGLAQIKDYQAYPERPALAWFTRCEEGESIAIRSALTIDPTDSAVERLLDKTLGLPGPANGWIALAIAMEAMRGAEPQLVGWREDASEPLQLCMVLPPPHKETTV
jgi:hypothetical protein